MRHRLFVHLVWTTLHRMPIITRDVAKFLAEFLPRIAEQERCRVEEIGIVRTHVHILLRIHPMAALPRLVQRLKGSSSAIGRRDHHLNFRWDTGYSIESVSVGALPQVAAYVANQHRRHPEQAIEGWPSSPSAEAPDNLDSPPKR